MGVSLDQTKEILNDVIAALRDSQEGLLDAAEHTASPDLKLMFMDFATQRANFRGELQNEVERLGDPSPRDSGTVLGALHRRWMELKAAVVSNEDRALIEECERGEDALIETYSKALTNEMPRYIQEILERQLMLIGAQRTILDLLEHTVAATSVA